MGSVGAMARGSADRYFQQDIKDAMKLVPEGIEGQVPYQGPGHATWFTSWSAASRPQWATRAAERSANCATNARFVRITNAGLRESHVHDVSITREAPNYPSR